MGYSKGHYGKYTGNARCCMDHAHTRVTKGNYKASERDDAAHIDYLKRDVLYDEKHGHSDEKMTADEKHISKLAGDMKYDKKHHGSPAHIKGSQKDHGYSNREFEEHEARVGTDGHGSPAKHVNKHMDKNHPHNKRKDHDESIHSHKSKK